MSNPTTAICRACGHLVYLQVVEPSGCTRTDCPRCGGNWSKPVMTDFQRGAAAMRKSVETMLRAHSEDMKRTANASRKVVEIGAYEASARLLWSYANGVIDMKLPEDATNAE